MGSCLGNGAAGPCVERGAKLSADVTSVRGYDPRPFPPVAFHLPMHFSRTRLASRRLIGVALLAMLLGQWSVLAHSIGHARALDLVAPSSSADHAHDDPWGHQADTAACALVDHLLTGQAPGGEPAAELGLPRQTSRVAAGAASHASWAVARPYEARGPPRA